MKTKINVEAVSNDVDALTNSDGENTLNGSVCPLCGLKMVVISNKELVCLDCGVLS